MKKIDTLIELIENNENLHDILAKMMDIASRDSYSKGDLMDLALDNSSNIDPAMPLGFNDDMAEWNIRPFPYVMDYRGSKFGKPLNLYEGVIERLFEAFKSSGLNESTTFHKEIEI